MDKVVSCRNVHAIKHLLVASFKLSMV